MPIKLPKDAEHQFNYNSIQQDKLTAGLMLVPALFLLFVFLCIPLVVSVGVSLTDERLISPNSARFVGLENYKKLLGLQIIEVNRFNRESGSEADEFVYKDKRYSKLRNLVRNNAELLGYSELSRFTVWDKSWVIVARDVLFIRSFLNTCKFVLMVVPIQVLLALALALALRRNFIGSGIIKLLFFTPVVTSMVVVCVVWSLMLHQQEGLINQVIASLWPLYDAIDWLNDPAWSLFAIAAMSAWQGVGVQMLILLAGLQAIPNSLYEAASLDGASRWSQFLHITLPGLRHTLIFVVLSTTIFAFALFVQVDVLTQGGPQDSTSTVLFYAIEKGFRQQQIAYGSTVCILYFVVILTLSLIQKKLLGYEK
ncbi:binding-protein-dependent transport system inner membrane protein [Catenovulum agarivorans DS-2]|uniref:Binding-protein-dependent transport system inner membrane protein n=1 Tax=Catenovulum agarivorans DS-2 TaxID=1328313 RepID=W7QS98_9ALTE|nr:sugar ABC transporter permease [Catenovulum agarivorans]EWH11887.1 binding-protein-dependent transport system inner membrane protein [Catenovulum agarivorans DS-2]